MLEFLEVRRHVPTRLGEHRQLVGMAFTLECRRQELGPGVVPVVNALTEVIESPSTINRGTPGRRGPTSRRPRSASGPIVKCSKLRFPGPPSVRRPGVAVEDAQRHLAGEQEERPREQKRQPANQPQAHNRRASASQSAP